MGGDGAAGCGMVKLRAAAQDGNGRAKKLLPYLENPEPVIALRGLRTLFLLFFGVWGVIIGPFVGAVVFELLGGKKVWESFKAGWGTFVGLLFSTIVKLICCGLMALVLLYGMIW